MEKYDIKIKKKKEEEILDLQQDKFNPENENDMKNKEKKLNVLKNFFFKKFIF